MERHCFSCRVCPTEFETGFRRWIARLAENLEEVVAIDGKTLRRSYDRRDSKAALPCKSPEMISVWSCANEVVLGQRAVPEATNETKTLPALLRVLHLKGAIVTIDAAGTDPEIRAQIQEAGADYVIGLKGNQKSLYRDVKATFDAREAIGRLPAPCRSVDGGHDRVEVRHCWGLDLADTGLKAERLAADGWTGLRTIGRVRAERHRPDGTVETEDRLFLSSLPAEPERLLRAVRHH